MKPSYAHLLTLTIACINALVMHTEQLLFCGSIRLHIGTVHDDHSNPVAGIALMAKRFIHVATVIKQNCVK